jgi:hypothetical protein
LWQARGRTRGVAMSTAPEDGGTSPGSDAGLPLLPRTRLVTICRSRRSTYPPTHPMARPQGPGISLSRGNATMTIFQGRDEPRLPVKRSHQQ